MKELPLSPASEENTGREVAGYVLRLRMQFCGRWLCLCATTAEATILVIAFYGLAKRHVILLQEITTRGETVLIIIHTLSTLILFISLFFRKVRMGTLFSFVTFLGGIFWGMMIRD